MKASLVRLDDGFIGNADSCFDSAINKPKFISSAQTLRDLQRVFNSSRLFAPWLDAERLQRLRSSRNQRKRRKDKHLQIKVGHGGTLDPMATGVLIVGVGKGTKQLQKFLQCTKSYEATVLFGAATDTFDAHGKVLHKASYHHLNEAMIENALARFKGNIMQRPPIYSALRIHGKRLYEYAREGKEVPVDIKERSVEVKELEIIGWFRGGNHAFRWPSEEAENEEKEVANDILYLQGTSADHADLLRTACTSSSSPTPRVSGIKRNFWEDEDEDLIRERMSLSNTPGDNFQHSVSGGLNHYCNHDIIEDNRTDIKTSIPLGSTSEVPSPAQGITQYEHLVTPVYDGDKNLESRLLSYQGPPAVTLRMTVTSGFYVRSLSHDLGKEVGSLGILSNLVRTRQGTFELGRNVFDYDDLAKGEDVWGPKVESMLDEWEQQFSEIRSHCTAVNK